MGEGFPQAIDLDAIDSATCCTSTTAVSKKGETVTGNLNANADPS